MRKNASGALSLMANITIPSLSRCISNTYTLSLSTKSWTDSPSERALIHVITFRSYNLFVPFVLIIFFFLVGFCMVFDLRGLFFAGALGFGSGPAYSVTCLATSGFHVRIPLTRYPGYTTHCMVGLYCPPSYHISFTPCNRRVKDIYLILIIPTLDQSFILLL